MYAGYGTHEDTRATFPNPLAADPHPVRPVSVHGGGHEHGGTAHNATWVGAVLDLTNGTYSERWRLPACGPDAVLQSRRFTHRAHRSLLVFEIAALRASKPCSVALTPCAGHVGGVQALGGGLYQVIGQEQPFDPSFPRLDPTVVAIAADPIPATVHFTPATPTARFMAVVRTTLEDGVSNSTIQDLATKGLKGFTQMAWEDLAAAHNEAWAAVWGFPQIQAHGGAGAGRGGGIEVEVGGGAGAGRGGGIEVEVGGAGSGAPGLGLGAAINSSMYYLVSSVRSDWPWGISEGGIASDAYYGHMFWSDAIMDGPLFAAINAPIADSLLEYRSVRLGAAKAIAKINNYSGAYVDA